MHYIVTKALMPKLEATMKYLRKVIKDFINTFPHWQQGFTPFPMEIGTDCEEPCEARGSRTVLGEV